MNKRQNEKKIPYLLTKEEFKILFSLEEILSKYIKYLNYMQKNNQIPYSVILINSSKDSIKETISKIRKTDIFIEIPNIENYYLILLENTICKNAIKFGSRLTSLITRDFMLQKNIIQHKLALFCFDNNSIEVEKLCYDIIYVIKNIESFKSDDYWYFIKRY